MAVDPLMTEWLSQQGQGQTPPFMQQTPFPNRMGGTGQPAPAPVTQGAPMQAQPVQMPGRMTPQNPTGGLPRPIIQPKNEALFGTYTSTYQGGRQMGQQPPPWTNDVAPSRTTIYLVRSAEIMPRLRLLCEQEGPEPLRRRHILAPPEFLTIA